jgi:hypothetical protein
MKSSAEYRTEPKALAPRVSEHNMPQCYTIDMAHAQHAQRTPERSTHPKVFSLSLSHPLTCDRTLLLTQLP